MDLSNNNKPYLFSINTKKHGIVEFSNLEVWRLTLIIENTKTMQDIDPSEFCLIVAKYLIYKKENIIYNEKYYIKNKSHNNIKLILEKEELDNFSNEIVTIYKSEILDYIDIDKKDELNNHLIIKKYFLKIKDDFDKLLEKTTGFTKLPYDKNLFDQVKQVSEVMKNAFPKNPSSELNRFTEATKTFSGKTPTDLVNMSEALKKALNNNPFNKSSENDEEENPQVNPTPIIPRHYELEALFGIREDFNTLLTVFNSYNKYNKDMQKFTNTIISNIKDKLEFQINANEKTSKIAFRFSIAAIIIALAIGVTQIFFSINSNKHTEKMNFNIEQLNNNISDLNIANKNYLDKIENLTNELILLKENKINGEQQ